MTLPSVAIVVVNWNGREFLGDCLNALRELDYPRALVEVIVVDNGSADDSVAFVRAQFPEVRLHEHEVNNYARANNYGVRTTTAPYVAFLNSDTRVEPGWLTALVDALEQVPAAGGAGSKILFEDGRLNSTGVELLPGFHFRDRGFGEPDRDQYEAGPVAGLSGCAVLWRRAALRDAGLLDEDFEMYYEDVDLSFRMRARGWLLWYVPHSVVHHLYNASIKKSPSVTKDFFGERNRLFLLARHLPHDLPGFLLRSRAVLEGNALVYKRTLPLVLKKWIETGATPREADLLFRAAFGAKIELSRFRRWARSEARTLRQAQRVYELVVSEAHRERDEARIVYGKMMEDARAAFWNEQSRRKDREKWLRIVMTEIQMRRVRELDEVERRFIAATEKEEEEDARLAQQREAGAGEQTDSKSEPSQATPS